MRYLLFVLGVVMGFPLCQNFHFKRLMKPCKLYWVLCCLFSFIFLVGVGSFEARNFQGFFLVNFHVIHTGKFNSHTNI